MLFIDAFFSLKLISYNLYKLILYDKKIPVRRDEVLFGTDRLSHKVFSFFLIFFFSKMLL